MFEFASRGPLMDPDPAPPAGGDQKPGAFDQAAFKTEVLGEMNKALNGFGKSMKTDIAKLFKDARPEPKPDDPSPDPKPSDDPKPDPSHKKPEVDPEKNALSQELRKLRAESEARIQALERKNEASEKAAETAKRESEVRALLGKHHFASDKAADTAFVIYSNAIQRDPDSGVLVADNLPAAKFLENDLPLNHPYLLAVKDIGGAGARGGKGVVNKKYDLDRTSSGYVLKPGNLQKYNAAEQAEIRQLIASS
ncbi:MAG: hypothetical protein NVS9B4_00760 [Candidatus Acidiferrum sp.]